MTIKNKNLCVFFKLLLVSLFLGWIFLAFPSYLFAQPEDFGGGDPGSGQVGGDISTGELPPTVAAPPGGAPAPVAAPPGGAPAGGAPGNINMQGTKIVNPLAVDTIEGLLRAIIAVVLVFAVPIIVFFIIYAGFLYVTARGNEQTIQQANRALLYAVLGGLLILGAFVLIEIVSNLINSIAGEPGAP